MVTIESRGELGLSLARALINTSHLPLLLFDRDLRVVCASRSFSSAFDIAPHLTDGRTLDDLGAGEWAFPQLRELLESALAGSLDISPYETDLSAGSAAPRRLMLNVQRLDDDRDRGPLVMLSIEDVTDSRRADGQIASLLLEKDDLLRERAVLLQEMQHRVANSLQIIASVLLLKARTVKSEESRLHLRDAHDRVMSVAAVQQHLQASLGEVDVGPYLTKLCGSLGSSMIRDSRPIRLDVRAEAATVTSREAVSLGLIVTELVINALKHAFPETRDGHIVVAYELHPPGWTLSVTDDGVGRPPASATARVGLGTSVVEALARQLGAEVAVLDAGPGARITITCLEPPPHHH
ncbi:histidine kinase [Phenylobacterium hankyongense]|uniref:histidine kinase n=1 Tax=Phenylobacterium hankyongense TaxID=1813876 RepID=A0A328AWW4_9CAUL|nr:PAS domain-containing sensor histidine kinase [Phenylobacterium hankyongense]RAK59612.1 histidine kinase [Phenylobacterium hankyongense]